ncbi:MAG: GNAT family N-acetyltransferase [Lewinellaceae bacterium]|nr:GNAT family N-acetyltransferase [Lewinellaceae bacterium]
MSAYETFCSNAPADFPVFLQHWYLDAVCENGNWAAAVVEDQGRVVGVWPHFIKEKWGKSYVAMPALCRQMGPYLLPEYRGTVKEPTLIESMLAQVPEMASFEQDFNYTAQNWLPLYWKDFQQTTRYSYQIEVGNLKQVWKNIKSDYRNNKIKKAQKKVVVYPEGTVEDFLTVHNRSFERQGIPAPISLGFLQKLDEALASHTSRTMFFARDRESGAIHSVAYLIWDRERAWYLMSGDDPALRKSGAGMLLIWEAIRYTNEVLGLPIFDFAGSMLPTVEPIRRHFGAQQAPYFRVWKDAHWLWKLKRKMGR